MKNLYKFLIKLQDKKICKVAEVTIPSLSETDGWRNTLNTDFSRYESMYELYRNSPWSMVSHGKRKYEYWCDKQLSLDKAEGCLVIKSEEKSNCSCEICKADRGIFTSCLETVGTEKNKGFYQAYGYFEAVCKVPDAPGMWAAFWLQCTGTGKVGSRGRDGSEIDIFESSFHEKNRTCCGSAIHYDAYSAPWYKCIDNIKDVGYDLYDGQYHKYSLHWTPSYYIFFVDDKLTWITKAGGVSEVPEYLRLSVEIRDEKYGPYGQEIGKFRNRKDSRTDFRVKSVKVWQKNSYEDFIRSEDEFKNKRKLYNKIFKYTKVLVPAAVFAAALIIFLLFI